MTSSATTPELIVVHPLVLLSVVDHYKRAALAPGKRVVGVLLGHWTGRTVSITNSYASKPPLNHHHYFVCSSI